MNAKKKRPKLAAKSPSKTPSNLVMMPGANGGSLRRGNPGNSGGSGRPPNEFLAWCAWMLNDPSKRKQVEEVMGDKTHAAFGTMWKIFTDRVHGKPTEKVIGDHEVTVTVRHE